MTTPTKTRNPDLETISVFVARDFCDDEIEVLIEILGYHGKEQGGCWDEVLGPSVELGDSFNLAGEYFPLTELEREAATEQALKQIEADIAEAIFQRD